MARGAFSGHGAVAEKTVSVEGLAELRKALVQYDRSLGKGFREAIDAAGESVRFSAQSLAHGNPSGMVKNRIDWAAMRIGITKTTGYVAPVERGVKSKGRKRYRRPKFKDVLLARALDPALAQNIAKVEGEFADALTDLAKAWERV